KAAFCHWLARIGWGAWPAGSGAIGKSHCWWSLPETVGGWHGAGFRMYWSMLSKIRKQAGRRRVSREGRDLIFRMAAENPTWGATRIHGERLMPGRGCIVSHPRLGGLHHRYERAA